MRPDAWVIKFDGGGRLLWSRQPGTGSGRNAVRNIKAGARVIKFDGEGHLLWKRQPEASDWASATGVATDKIGNAYVVGTTGGSLGAPRKGGDDAWVIKYAR